MTKKLALFSLYCCALSLLFLGGCSGEGNEVGSGTVAPRATEAVEKNAAVATLDGKVAVGYLRGARVFLDRNANRRHDAGEPLTTSTVGGVFSLNVQPGDGDLYPLVVQVTAGQTIDEGSRLMATENYQLEAPSGHWQFVSPLTGMVKIVGEKSPGLTELQAVMTVRSAFGIDGSVSLFEDYLARGTESFAGESPRQFTESRRAYKVAQAIATLMVGLQADLERALGGPIEVSGQAAVAYLINDQILKQAPLIKQALAKARNTKQEVEVASLLATLSAKIDTRKSVLAQLNFYKQRIAQKLPIWDMQAPQLVSVIPPPGSTVAVDVLVEILFSEALDEALIDDSLVVLFGPNGQQPGTLSYYSAEKKLTFSPDQSLLLDCEYRVLVKKELTDLLGNALEQDISWLFFTPFAQPPPALPDI